MKKKTSVCYKLQVERLLNVSGQECTSGTEQLAQLHIPARLLWNMSSYFHCRLYLVTVKMKDEIIAAMSDKSFYLCLYEVPQHWASWLVYNVTRLWSSTAPLPQPPVILQHRYFAIWSIMYQHTVNYNQFMDSCDTVGVSISCMSVMKTQPHPVPSGVPTV